jgi:hypothetical protein
MLLITIKRTLLCSIFIVGILCHAEDKDIAWKIHDTNRPHPSKVTPKPIPSDAIILFSGTDLSLWQKGDNDESLNWQIIESHLINPKGKGDIQTKQAFGNCQLHIEWATPPFDPNSHPYDRGNSGIYFMQTYELQIFDSYPEANIYADGMAASIYGQYPPLVNASLPPLEWQTFDVVFLRPVFDKQGALKSPAIMTVFHNGIVVHHCQSLTGPTAHQKRPAYKAHADKLPIVIQGHGNPVRFRNIWIRELE